MLEARCFVIYVCTLGLLFQLECTVDWLSGVPALQLSGYHTNWIRAPFSPSWIFQESILTELQVERIAFLTSSGSAMCLVR